MKAINRSMGLVEWLLLITLSILWGGSFFFVGIVVHALPRFTIVALRVGLAAISLNVIVLAMRLNMPRSWQLWTAFFGMGLLNNMIPFSLIVWGQTHIASGLASILNATTPLFTVIVAHFLTSDEKMTRARLAGVVVGFAGVVLMIGPEALEGLGTNTFAQLAVLGAAISYAFAGVFGRRFRNLGIAPLVTATGQVTASTRRAYPFGHRGGATLEPSNACAGGMGCHCRARLAFYRARLHTLLPHPCYGGRQQCTARNISYPDQRYSARQHNPR